jgi:hypothetical protein
MHIDSGKDENPLVGSDKVHHDRSLACLEKGGYGADTYLYMRDDQHRTGDFTPDGNLQHETRDQRKVGGFQDSAK